MDLRDLGSLDQTAVSPLLVAQLRALDDHRQFLLIRGNAPVQRIIDRINAPFCYLSSLDTR